MPQTVNIGFMSNTESMYMHLHGKTTECINTDIGIGLTLMYRYTCQKLGMHRYNTGLRSVTALIYLYAKN